MTSACHQGATPLPLLLLLLAVSVAIGDHGDAGRRGAMPLLTGLTSPRRLSPTAPPGEAGDAETAPKPLPPKPLPRITLPHNETAADAHEPPLGDGEDCRGHWDLGGRAAAAARCPGASCCGTCHARYCCGARPDRLDQDACPDPPPPARRARRGGRPRGPPKEAEVEDGGGGAETPPRPLPQIMMPRNMTAADALKPPLGAAQVAPPPGRQVDVDVCRGYYDVMGQFDVTFNCTKDTYLYCCGSCHYRFCCEHQRDQLDQDSCNNYKSPKWATTQTASTPPTGNRLSPDFETLQQNSSSTAYVIGGVISFTLVVAVGIRIAFSKVSRRARHRDMPRGLVDILRHQSSPLQQGQRGGSTLLSATPTGRSGKALYTPVQQGKDNRLGTMHHHLNPRGGASPKHSASLERGGGPGRLAPQMPPAATLLSSGGLGAALGGGAIKHSSGSFSSRPPARGAPHPSFSHSFHNLAQLPPPLHDPRYSSLKRLERDLEDYSSGYYSSRRRPNGPPTHHSSQHHLPWGGGDYTLDYAPGARGTLPLHGSKQRLHQSGATPNPYPLPAAPPPGPAPRPAPRYGGSFERPPRRVRSQDQLLMLGEGNTLGRLGPPQGPPQGHHYQNLQSSQSHGPPPQQYYRERAAARTPSSQTLRRSHERLLVSPDRLEDRLYGHAVSGGDRGVGGGVPTMGRLSHQKAQSQQNICATPTPDRHHMVKMNSHPTSGHGGGWEPHGGAGPQGGGWDPHQGGGTMGAGHPGARRMAFATKRQSTVEQLHYIPGGGGGGGGGAGAEDRQQERGHGVRGGAGEKPTGALTERQRGGGRAHPHKPNSTPANRFPENSAPGNRIPGNSAHFNVSPGN